MNLHHDEVRKQRSTLAVCPSAKENVCVTDILYEIIEKETYKKDYEEITLGLCKETLRMSKKEKSEKNRKKLRNLENMGFSTFLFLKIDILSVAKK